MDDLTICKRIAEIEGVQHQIEQADTLHPYLYSEELNSEYDPLTDDALCFQFMNSYRVHCKPSLNESWSCRASSFGDTPDNGYVNNESLNRAICLAIIEVYK
jgi:hypothetical protein